MVSPQTAGEAWRRFALEMAGILAIVGGILAIALLLAPGGATLMPKGRMDYLWIILGAGMVLPLAFGYEIWLLGKRLAAFRRGEVFVDDDEIAPADAPAPSRRKWRETPAQARRRRAFWREMALITVVWLFCTGLFGWVAVDQWLEGKPVGTFGPILLGLVILYPVIVYLSVYLKNQKDRGL